MSHLGTSVCTTVIASRMHWTVCGGKSVLWWTINHTSPAATVSAVCLQTNIPTEGSTTSVLLSLPAPRPRHTCASVNAFTSDTQPVNKRLHFQLYDTLPLIGSPWGGKVLYLLKFSSYGSWIQNGLEQDRICIYKSSDVCCVLKSLT